MKSPGSRSRPKSARIPMPPPAASAELDGDRRGLAAADAERRDAALLAVALQGVNQRGQDTSSRRADGMAERAGSAVHVDAIVRDADVLHCRHGDDRKGLVDLVQVDVGSLPSS